MAKKPAKGSRPPKSKDASKAKSKAKATKAAESGTPKEARKQGRQSTYTRELADEVCRLMSEGKTLNSIARIPGMPPRTTVLGWKNADVDGFADRYARAREDLLDCWEDELMDVVDDGSNDYYEKTTRDGETIEVFNRENVERSKLRADTRKWMLAKLRNTKYGDKIEQTHKADAGFMDAWKLMSGELPAKK